MKRIPTPTARDWKDTPGSAVLGKNPDGSVRDRTDRLAIYAYEKEREESGQCQGQLSPDWVEWLMGWPIGWTRQEIMELEWRDWSEDPAFSGEIPRVTISTKDRANRLKAIGNGQVPAVAALAWETLTEQMELEL